MADVRYVFTASGHESVERAFIGIEQAARKSSRGVERAYEGQERAARRSASVQESAARRPASRLEQLARQVERDQIRAAQREARAKTQALQYVQRIRDRHFADEQRKEERSLQVKSRTEQRIAKERERAMAYVARIRDKHFADEERKHQQGVRSAVRAGEAKGRAQFRLEQQFRERMQRERSGTLGRIGGEMRGAALGGAAAIGALGVGVGGAAVKDAYALQSAANRISINSRKSGEKFIDATTLRKEFEATALASGGTVKGEQVADAVSRYITMTGDIKSARQLQGTFATVATATDADIGAVAETAAAISEQFKINGIEEFRESLALLVAQGKSGAFELKDAATQYQRLAASAGSFNIGTGVEAVKTLGGLTQIARSATGSPESAATAVENLFTNLKLKADDLAGEDVDIYTRDKKGNATGTRKVQDIIADMIQKVGGSDIDIKNEKLAKYLGEQGIRSVNPLIAEFTRTFHSAKGNEKAKSAAGRASVEAMIQRFTNVPGSWQDVETDAAQAKGGPGAKFSAMWDKMTAAAGDKLLPVLDRMIDSFELSDGAIDAFVGTLEILLEWMQMVGRAFGILKSPIDDKELRKKQEQRRIKQIDKDLAALPSEENAMALAAKGDLEGAMAIAAKVNAPETILAEGRLNNAKAIAQSKLGITTNIDEKLGAAGKLGIGAQSAQEFEKIYAGLGSSPDSAEAQVRANIVAHSLAANPASDTYSTKDFIPGENADQRAARLGFGQGQAERKLQHGGKADEAGAQVAATGLAAILERITKSAAPAAAALEKMGQAAQPSISSG
jgi:hypothetical protein